MFFELRRCDRVNQMIVPTTRAPKISSSNQPPPPALCGAACGKASAGAARIYTRARGADRARNGFLRVAAERLSGTTWAKARRIYVLSPPEARIVINRSMPPGCALRWDTSR
jgi:hypothetical protein